MNINAIATKDLGDSMVGKTVVVRKSFFSAQYKEGDRRFKVRGGFGASAGKIGRAVFGVFFDGEESRIDRHDVEGIAVNLL